MVHAMEDLQRAVFERLVDDSEIVSLIGDTSVHDRLIESESFPYIAMGQASYADWSTSTEDGAEIVLTVHIWDRGQSREKSVQILERVQHLLSAPDFELQNHRLVTQRVEFAQVRRIPDSQDYHGLVRLRTRSESIIE